MFVTYALRNTKCMKQIDHII